MTGIKGIILCLLLAFSLELKSVASEPHREMNKVSAHDKSVGSILQRNTRQSDGQLRLVDGGSVSSGGRLEVFLSGQWGTVCRQGWDANDAQVACNQLGYPSVETTLDTSFGPGSSSQPVLLGNLDCGGHESELRNCPSGLFSCSYLDFVGIVCSTNNPSSVNIAAIVAPIVVVLVIIVIAVIVTIVICMCVCKNRSSKRRSTPDNDSYPQPTHQTTNTTTTTTADVEQTRRTSTNVPMATMEPSAPHPPPMFNPDMSHSYNYPATQPSNPQAYPPPTFPSTNDLPPPYPVYN